MQVQSPIITINQYINHKTIQESKFDIDDSTYVNTFGPGQISSLGSLLGYKEQFFKTSLFLKGQTNLQIQAVQSITRQKQVIDTQKINSLYDEIYQKTENAVDNQPSTLDALVYFKLQPKTWMNGQTPVVHQLLELCAKSDQGIYHRFIIERDAKATISETWQSRVKFTYLGQEIEQCSIANDNWLSVEKKQNFKLTGGAELTEANVPFIKVLAIAYLYIKKFNNYNLLFNCQHFATNLYNYIANQRQDFPSNKLMRAHSVKAEVRSDDKNKKVLAWLTDEEITQGIKNYDEQANKNGDEVSSNASGAARATEATGIAGSKGATVASGNTQNAATSNTANKAAYRKHRKYRKN